LQAPGSILLKDPGQAALAEEADRLCHFGFIGERDSLHLVH
jgi:hypothetical protein